ncbi:dihydrofolate synthase/folylpolyglutamate synthase [Tetragenococcus muriaticus PMC-11-5]|nr:folylpolyglutamate synthase/dihydrofolate synthase family protein [Tetragenococcus muriaticus]KFN92347.1 dihydrofolate synthase/folylpolyglutamate synthase [Tetragenococcus muriaticus PMC-11-5]GMA46565.1 tetrahydrofolate synthase [Tetragenococcus muriaticus]
MIKTAQEAIQFIESRQNFGSKPGLQRINALLDQLHHPEKDLTFVHVAGTNGKGSTVSFLSAMLQEAGLTVGTFTSPYIEELNERIAINSQPISDETMTTIVQTIQPLIESADQNSDLFEITEFELLTAVAFLYFKEANVDLVVLEVGLGGLYDSTNVVSPLLTAITTIGMDHMEVLGDTVEEIATQKAGIIKKGVPVVTGNITANALAVIDDTAQKQQAEVSHLTKDYQFDYQGPDPKWGEQFDFYNEEGRISKLSTSLLGKHQVENAAVAVQLFYLVCKLQRFPFTEKVVKNGLKNTSWPARMERISQNPLIILDGAHNEQAMKRLVENMTTEFKDRRIFVLFSALERKNVEGMLQQLLGISQAKIYLTNFDYPGVLRLEKNYQQVNEERITIVSLWQFGLANILDKISSDDIILVTGSLYFVAEVRQLIKDITS